MAGETAREAYLVRALAHLNEFKIGRVQSLAYALFPLRTQAAALAATQRVTAHAVDLRLVTYKDEVTTQHRYYALTRRGARYLNERADLAVPATQTNAKLECLVRAPHREFTTLLTCWARAQEGLLPVNEFELWALDTCGEVRERFQAIPDGLTFDLDPATPVVYWHEIELSRRSQWTDEETAKAKAAYAVSGKPFRGSGKRLFKVLLWRIHRLRYIAHAGREFDVRLVLHCATPQIKRDLSAFIEETFTDNEVTAFGLRKISDGYALKYAGGDGGGQRGDGFLILLDLLPESSAKVWHNDGIFPWAGASCYEQRHDLRDEYLKGA